MGSDTLKRLILIFSIIYLSLTYFIWLLPKDIIVELGVEDHYFPIVATIGCLLAGSLFFLKYAKTKNSFFLILAIAFFFGFGEKLSWGQRLFDIPVPEALQQANAQKEMTIHNLNIFYHSRFLRFTLIFNCATMIYCCFVPWLNRLYPRFSSFAKKIRMPIVPLTLSILFFITILSLKFMQMNIHEQLVQTAYNVRKSNLTFLFAMLGLWFLISEKQGDGRCGK